MKKIARIALGFFALLASCTGGGKENAEAPPNLVFILSDDHACQAVSAYSEGLIETPHIDRIAQEGMLFQNAFVTNSICAPSRAVILTGMFSHLTSSPP